MKVKARNIIEVVLRVVILAMLCIPFFAVLEHWQYDNSIVYHGIASLKRTESVSALTVSFDIGGINVIAGILFMLALVVGIVLSIRQLLRKGQKANDKLLAVFSIIEFVTFVFFVVVVLLYRYESEFWRENAVPGVGLYLTSILVIASTLLTFIGYKHAKKNGIVEDTKPNGKGKEMSNDLRELKDLLDSGVITQEEYDAKKKQLLGL